MFVLQNTALKKQTTEETNKKKLVEKLIDELPELERLVITLYYYEGMTLEEISDIMQTKVSETIKIHSKILGDIKSKLSEYNGE